MDLSCKNNNLHTPLLYATYHGQNEGIKFALTHNKMMKQLEKDADEGKSLKTIYPIFDFNQQGGKSDFTPLHYVVYQNNYQILH
jgi:ankyrin repeat protein